MKYQDTPRDRLLATLDGKKTEPLPFSWGFGINEPAKWALLEYTGLQSMEELDQYLRSVDDAQWVGPDYCGPADRCCRNDDGSWTDEWGIVRKFISVQSGGGYDELCKCPLEGSESLEDLRTYRFPKASWWDMSVLPRKIREINGDTRYAIKMGNGNMFEHVTWLHGFENTLMDLIANPEWIHLAMERVTNYYMEFFDAALSHAQGMIDIVFTADDLAGQEGLLMSRAQIQEFITPYHKRLNDFLHSRGVKTEYHSCGAVIDAVPDLIDCGVDILESLQFYTKGMEPGLLQEKFGGKICFQGGVSVQKTLVTGTPEDVKAEVAMLKETLGRNGGYILAPAHFIQAGTPPENILAMLEATGKPLPKKAD